MSTRRPAPTVAPPRTPLHAVLAAGVARRQTANVSVQFADHKKVVEWAKNKPEFAQQEWGGFYLLKAVVARCEELYGEEGIDKLNAAIVHYTDLLDLMTFWQKMRTHVDDPTIQRVQTAFYVDAVAKSELKDAQAYLAAAEKQRLEDAEPAQLRCEGGGKCKMDLGTSRGTKREQDGGPSYDQLFPPANIQYYKGVINRVLKKGYNFPRSLW